MSETQPETRHMRNLKSEAIIGNKDYCYVTPDQHQTRDIENIQIVLSLAT